MWLVRSKLCVNMALKLVNVGVIANRINGIYLCCIMWAGYFKGGL